MSFAVFDPEVVQRAIMTVAEERDVRAGVCPKCHKLALSEVQCRDELSLAEVRGSRCGPCGTTYVTGYAPAPGSPSR